MARTTKNRTCGPTHEHMQEHAHEHHAHAQGYAHGHAHGHPHAHGHGVFHGHAHGHTHGHLHGHAHPHPHSRGRYLSQINTAAELREARRELALREYFASARLEESAYDALSLDTLISLVIPRGSVVDRVAHFCSSLFGRF